MYSSALCDHLALGMCTHATGMSSEVARFAESATAVLMDSMALGYEQRFTHGIDPVTTSRHTIECSYREILCRQYSQPCRSPA